MRIKSKWTFGVGVVGVLVYCNEVVWLLHNPSSVWDRIGTFIFILIACSLALSELENTPDPTAPEEAMGE